MDLQDTKTAMGFFRGNCCLMFPQAPRLIPNVDSMPPWHHRQRMKTVAKVNVKEPGKMIFHNFQTSDI
jgi:hypothetical protein